MVVAGIIYVTLIPDLWPVNSQEAKATLLRHPTDNCFLLTKNTASEKAVR